MNNKRKVLIISIIVLIITLIGSTYAFFMYSKITKAFTLTSGDINIEFVNGDNNINLTYAYPISDNYAKANLEKLGYVDFNVNGNIQEDKQVINYEIYLEEDSKNTLDPNYIKVYLTNDTNQEVVEPTIYNLLDKTTYANSDNGKVIYKTSKKGEFNDKYRIYVWIDSSYTQNVVNQTFSFKVNLYAYNGDLPKSGSETIKDVIVSHETEDVTVTDDEGIIYLSGDNDTINFNYVWYSGKLWRIIAIYPDGTMKMITQDAITGIYFGETADFEKSWAYDWLNEDFFDTLYNYQNIIVTDAKWELTALYGSPYHPEPYKIVETAVGLLNTYEYYQSIEKINVEKFQKGYLNNGYQWWLSSACENSVESTLIYAVDSNDNYDGLWGGSPNNVAWGVRPAVILKSNIVFEGEGTKDNPYKILADKAPGKVNEKLNNRLSGEYVKVDNRIYRIVGIENGTTKLTSIDYVRDSSNSNIITKQYGEADVMRSYEDVVNSNNDSYWGAYLNKTWLTPNLKKYLVPGNYYLGLTMIVNETGAHASSYKGTICQDINTEETTKECAKTERTWTGLVGLPRIGEMFAFPVDEDNPNSVSMYLITPYEATGIAAGAYINDGRRITTAFYDSLYAVRPSIYLKSDVIITGGDGRSINTPYTIGFPND